ncbi:hypothetical protein GCM10010112_71180 [Actinoplanes lobatus]|uniref:Cytochrome P450 n=2 Tax=Actinoplanes TaxID=1865 RepID=A0A7W7HLT0_9ACTN|nr:MULTISPECIES: hypothetical protein [Actinoplanes]MBB4752903.1 cytochrome P450 [Actinoplanes lobatus]MBW6435791.1 hypothetical protein [Actinoplanes hulinensis]GGN88050.1 hypothetical protein GCM10010112_71180 [Actinoplanes lobatus]GIE39511.1 hypothetical protein Alo02nite_24090 [Actinoplanes lobatus]
MPDDEPQRRPSQIICEMLGIPERTFTPEEERAFREASDRADAEVRAIIERRRRRAA